MMARQASPTRLTAACIFLPLRVNDSSSAVMYPLTYCSYGGARETNHGWSVVHFTEDANRHFVFENPPPPPAKNLTRNELRLFELSRLSWSERQPTPQPQTYCRQQTIGPRR